MSPADTLLADLEAHGIELQPDGHRLRYRPKAAMSPALAERVKQHKGELLAALTARPQPPAVGQVETHADREWRRFPAVCRRWPDGRGWYDPTQTAAVVALARAAEPPPAPRGAATLPNYNNQLTINPK